MEAARSAYHEYVGNMHVHTRYSDGSGTVPEVAIAAGTAGLNFVCVTDHNTLGAAVTGEAGYHGRVLVVVGVEVNQWCNHYLAYGVTKVPPKCDSDPQRVIDNVNAQGGFGFIAHPFELGSKYIMGGRTYPWTDWNATGYRGIEVWNALSQWRDSMPTVLRALWFGLLHPGDTFMHPNPRSLAAYDAEAMRRRAVLVVGSDCHAIRLVRGLFTFGSYEYSFHGLNVHVLLEHALTGDGPADTERLLDAIGAGQLFGALHLLGNPRGFRFWGEVSSHPRRTATMGGELKLGSAGSTSAFLRFWLPRGAGRCVCRLVCEGITVGERRVARRRGHGAFRVSAPGAYRLEVLKPCGWLRRGLRTWVLTNPIWLRA